MNPTGSPIEMTRLFDALEDVQFWVKDRAGRYCAMNRACLLNYGINSLSQVVGLTDFDLSPPHIATQFQIDDDWVLHGGTIVNRIELVGRFDHTAVWCVTNKIPLRDSRGRIVGTALCHGAVHADCAPVTGLLSRFVLLPGQHRLDGTVHEEIRITSDR